MSVDRNLLIECTSNGEANKVFDYLKSKGELINTDYFNFDISLYAWHFVGYYKIQGGWTIGSKNNPNFGNKIISATEFLNTSLVGRWVKFLKEISTKCSIGSYDLIIEDDHKNICMILRNYRNCNRNRLNNGDLELMPEGWSPDVEEPVTMFEDLIIYKEDIIPEYVECVKVLKNGYGELGKIYKVKNWNHSDIDCWLEGTTSGCASKSRFKPSTKEAYDAQINNNNFIVGKWYRVNSGYKKFHHLKGNKFYYSEDIYNDKFNTYPILDYAYIDAYKYELLTDLTEIQPYLPDNHPDKINKEMTIEEIQEECKRRFPNSDKNYWDISGMNHPYNNDQIRLATKEEITSISNVITLSKTDHNNYYHNTGMMPVNSGFHKTTITSCISQGINEKPLIDNVQSINVNLRTKKLNNKLKF